MEKHKRSIIKSITWRVTATLATILLVFFFTENITLSLSIGFLEVITKLFIYYVHERIWDGVKWGVK